MERAEISDGVHSAIVVIMDSTGNYPITRQAILDAIRDGVREAFVALGGLGGNVSEGGGQ